MHLLIKQPGQEAFDVDVTNRFELMDLPSCPRWASIGGTNGHTSLQLAPGTTITILEDDE